MEQANNTADWVRATDVPVLRWPRLDGLGVRAVITSREGGTSTGAYSSLNLGLHVGDESDAVLTNRRRAAATVGLGLEDLVFCNQAHGRQVVTVTAEDRGRGAHRVEDAIDCVDALVTADQGVGLVVMVADCVPIVLVDPDAGVVAAVHSGWRGTVAKVAAATVDHMVCMGCRRNRLLAAIGPAIPPERYEVGDDVEAAAREAFGKDAPAVVLPRDGGRWSFDLWTSNRMVLAEAGIRDERLLAAEYPTGDGTAFFSDRARRPCGRFAAIVRR
jgi:polyphenol oxidase